MLLLIVLGFLAIAAGLVWFLLAHEHGEKEPARMLWLAAAIGLAGAIAASYLEGLAVQPADLRPLAGTASLLRATLVIAAIEEIIKFLPLALILYRKPYFNEHTDGVLYFALVGLGFGLPENILYTLQFGARAGVGRIMLTPLFHAAIITIAGYYLAKRKLGETGWRAVGAAVAVTIILHAAYDFGLLSGSLFLVLLAIMITLGLSAMLFALYMQAEELDKHLTK